MKQPASPLLLFCKTYAPDLPRARRLALSVARHNREGIPLYFSVPAAEIALFRRSFVGIPCHFLSDEEILDLSARAWGPLPSDFPPQLCQQLVKLEFWRRGLCRHYFWVDADGWFIRDFGAADFLVNADTPRTVCHDSADIFGYARRVGAVEIELNFLRMAGDFMTWFGRSGPAHNFGPMPVLWTARVLEHLAVDYLPRQDMDIYGLLRRLPCEIQLYGEYFLHCRLLPLVPCAPFFKVYHYAGQFFEGQAAGDWEQGLAGEYLGVCLQSNWARFRKETGFRSLARRLRLYLRQLPCRRTARR